MTLIDEQELAYSEYLNKLKKISDLFNSMVDDEKSLQQQMDNKGHEIQDVLHIIEDLNFNACEGYELAKRLKILRNERRIIKDKLDQFKYVKKTINAYQSNGINTCITRDVEDIKDLADRQRRSKWKIRRLHDLNSFLKISNKQRGLN
jgi:hypothetical protein